MDGWGGAVGLAENKGTQPSLAGAWAELGKTSFWGRNYMLQNWSDLSDPTVVNSLFSVNIPKHGGK